MIELDEVRTSEKGKRATKRERKLNLKRERFNRGNQN